MKDAELRREYHRLCRKKGFDDSERSFKIFKAGVEYGQPEPERDILSEMMNTQAQREEWEG